MFGSDGPAGCTVAFARRRRCDLAYLSLPSTMFEIIFFTAVPLPGTERNLTFEVLMADGFLITFVIIVTSHKAEEGFQQP
jgi:hypothetical protein